MADLPTRQDPASVWSRVASYKRPRLRMAYPRQPDDGGAPPMVEIAVLTQGELNQARACAERATQKELEKSPARNVDSIAYRAVFNDKLMVEILLRSVYADGTDIKVHPDAEAMQAWLAPDELAVLFNAYVDHQHRSGPLVTGMSEEEMDAWLDMLEEGAGADPLGPLTSEVVKDLLRHSAARLRSLRTAKP